METGAGHIRAEGAREIANSKLFFWDLCKRYGVTYRTYGEFVELTVQLLLYLKIITASILLPGSSLSVIQ